MKKIIFLVEKRKEQHIKAFGKTWTWFSIFKNCMPKFVLGGPQ
jgi:hypothetical protein